MPSESVSFDQAASYYDQTRGHPPEVSASIAANLGMMLPPRARVLEVGIGTGRIARPLISLGFPVYGVDLSPKMMHRLRENLPSGAVPPGLAQADASQLPWKTGVFDAVLGVHVFHLIAYWQKAINEIRRVLKPGGRLFAGYDWRPEDAPISQVADKWGELTREQVGESKQPGVRWEALEAAMLEQGARLSEHIAAEWVTPTSFSTYIDLLEQGTFSSSWRIPEQVRRECAARLRSWAAETFPGMDEVDVPRRFIWHSIQWDAG